MSDGFLTSPIVTFERDGVELELGRSLEPIIHLHGTKGLGLPPVQFASSERIGGDGDIVRGVRYGSREVYVPIAIIMGSKAEVDAARNSLYKLLAPHLGMVTVQVFNPNSGTIRRIEGYYKSGLEGDFADGYYGHMQTLGLTFYCPDPWWRGEEKQITLRINPGVKPFISNTVEFFPIVLTSSSAQGSFDINVAGDAEVAPLWEFIGEGTDPTISNGKESFTINTTLKAGQSVSIDMETGSMTPDMWEQTSQSSQPFKLKPGKSKITATMVDATVSSLIRGTYQERFLEAI